MSIKIALAGNPNCGKTTLFNALTGSNQFVGNWPGVTVEKKEGRLKGHKDVIIMDLPGIYSLSPYTLEEVVARNYLINERPDAIINIVDGTNLERNLYLSTQIMELGIPVVMAVNMMDLVQKTGNKIHIDKLSKKLGCEVVEISALKGTGITKAAEKAIAAAQKKGSVTPVHEFAQDVEDVIKTVESKLTGVVADDQKRFFAIKLIEKEDVSAEVKALEDKFDDDTESIITNERYVYISSIIGQCYTKSAKGKKLTTSDKIDRIVTNRWLALPIFAVVMFIVYYVSVTTVGTIVTDSSIGDLKSNYLSEKIIKISYDSYVTQEIFDYPVEKVDHNQIELKADTNKVHMGELLSYFTSIGNISDIQIESTPLEEVIKKLYKERR